MLRDPDKNYSPDRVFVFEEIEGEKPRTTGGTVDNRLFKGGNKLHAILGPDSLWSLKYDQGAIPPILDQKYTSVSKLMEAVVPYFEKRGVKVKKFQ